MEAGIISSDNENWHTTELRSSHGPKAALVDSSPEEEFAFICRVEVRVGVMAKDSVRVRIRVRVREELSFVCEA